MDVKDIIKNVMFGIFGLIVAINIYNNSGYLFSLFTFIPTVFISSLFMLILFNSKG